MPVGRFMLDVHGEDRSTWAASDAICAALQINNHLQDCGKDYLNLDRVYLPQDAMAASGATVEMLGEGLAPWFPKATLAIDLDRVPALAEDRERLWAQVSAADFLSDAEKRALLGLEKQP